MHEDEEIFGQPSFELRIRDGEPLVSGCYFMYPVIQVQAAEWDAVQPDRILVTANDGSKWYADNVPRVGVVNVVLSSL